MQRKQDGNTCGAFVLAYYQWEKTGCETVQEEAGRAYVEQLYREIVFGSTMPGFETYSNPVLMMRWLAQQGTRPVFYLGENPLVQKKDGGGFSVASQGFARYRETPWLQHFAGITIFGVSMEAGGNL